MTSNKLIILLEDGSLIPNLLRKVGKEKIWYLDTKNVDPEKEYNFIDNSIGRFYVSNRDMLIIKFSGDEDIAKRIGDERPEMIVPFGLEEAEKTLFDFINIYYKETDLC